MDVKTRKTLTMFGAFHLQGGDYSELVHEDEQ